MKRSRLFVAVGVLALVALAPAGPVYAQDHAPAEPAHTTAAPAQAEPGHAEPGHAEGGHPAGDHEEIGAIPSVKQGAVVGIASLVVFGIVFAVLSVAVWPKINKGLSDRERKIREEIEGAELARKQAKDALEQYQQSLSQARAEAQKMLEQTKAQQMALAAELKGKADIELAALRDRAMRDIDSAKRAAIAEIYADSATMSAKIAEKILRREIRPADQQALVEESLAKMQAVSN